MVLVTGTMVRTLRLAADGVPWASRHPGFEFGPLNGRPGQGFVGAQIRVLPDLEGGDRFATTLGAGGRIVPVISSSPNRDHTQITIPVGQTIIVVLNEEGVFVPMSRTEGIVSPTNNESQARR
jgi:hypothetical protein